MSNSSDVVASAPRIESKQYQVHLKGKGYSGRGVRYRILKQSELDSNEVLAAKTLDDGYSKIEHQVEVSRLALSAMVTAYTDPGVKEPQTARWTSADKGYLERQWDAVFTTKDTAVLRNIFHTEHGVNEAELEAILKGKVEVLAD